MAEETLISPESAGDNDRSGERTRPWGSKFRYPYILTEMVQMVVVQGKTPEAALKETTQRLKEIYNRY